MKPKAIQSGLKYKPQEETPITPERRKVLDRIVPGSRVLEVGSHGGHFSKLLLDRECRLTAVELDPDAARLVHAIVPEVIVGDIEDRTVLDQLEGRQYDFILFMHVLEHLVDPWQILDKCRKLLNPSGVLIALLPNVASWRVRKALFFRGNFEYTDVGILDRTHLRFFTVDSGKQLFEQSGYRIEDPEVLDASVPLEVRLRRMFGTGVSQPWHRWMVRRYPNLCADILYFEAHPQ
jgi:SAM-dependent methyltransferase